MDLDTLKTEIEGIDIYLLDQILKGRYHTKDVILDVGCGNGRNLKWFYNNDYTIYGVDLIAKRLDKAKKQYSKQKEHFSIQNIMDLNFEKEKFDHIICNAILHFANSKQDFILMITELLRVLKPNGTIFIRMATIESITERVVQVSEGVYKLPDKTTRYLLTKELLLDIQTKFNLMLLEKFKYVNVDDLRSMATFILQKKVY
ncbi:MAG: class I SAM-dependent methyltransferase [Flavobacteriaceae bacterium]|nr:class I SAM-dependent methyltransferase [Flavobacteriaceae bacterium]